MNLFVFAMDYEARYIRSVSKTLSEERIGFGRVYHLSHKGKEFLICVSGVGKVLAASSLAGVLATHPEITRAVNLGIGCSLDPALAPLRSAVVGTKFVQHDLDTTALGDPAGYVSGMDMVYVPAEENTARALLRACHDEGVPAMEACIASGDLFVASDEQKDAIAKRFGCLSVDMEAASYATTCYAYGVPFAALRVVSDAVDHAKEYLENRGICGEIACKIGLTFLEENE